MQIGVLDSIRARFRPWCRGDGRYRVGTELPTLFEELSVSLTLKRAFGCQRRRPPAEATAQETQRRAAGWASSRAGGIGTPHTSHVP